MSRLLLILLGAAVSLPLAGCDTAGGSDSVEGRFVLSLLELPQVPLMVTVQTEETYHCLLPLALDVDWRSDDEVRVKVLGLGETDACPAAIGPASGRITLPTQSGDYHLALVFGRSTDRYTVEVRPGGAVLVGRVTRFSRAAR